MAETFFLWLRLKETGKGTLAEDMHWLGVLGTLLFKVLRPLEAATPKHLDSKYGFQMYMKLWFILFRMSIQNCFNRYCISHVA